MTPEDFTKKCEATSETIKDLVKNVDSHQDLVATRRGALNKLARLIAGDADRKTDLKTLREFSLFTSVVERVFNLLQYASPATWFFGTRAKAQRADMDMAAFKAITIKRGQQIDCYVFAWLVVEAAAAASVVNWECTRPYACALVTMRIVDIFQSAVNLNIFDRFRITSSKHYVSSLARALVLNCVGFVELLGCFGVIYAANLEHLQSVGKLYWQHGFYFSTITQLTIGYGDIVPLGNLKAVVILQSLSGFFFSIVVLARFVAFLPVASSVIGDGNDQG